MSEKKLTSLFGEEFGSVLIVHRPSSEKPE